MDLNEEEEMNKRRISLLTDEAIDHLIVALQSEKCARITKKMAPIVYEASQLRFKELEYYQTIQMNNKKGITAVDLVKLLEVTRSRVDVILYRLLKKGVVYRTREFRGNLRSWVYRIKTDEATTWKT